MAEKWPTPGKDDFVSLRDDSRVGSNNGLNPQMIERLFYGSEIPGTIVNYGNHQSNPFVLGSNRAMRRSRQQAARSARANALNKDSIL